jgi:hypothetical protein
MYVSETGLDIEIFKNIFCGLVVRDPEVPGSIPGATRFSEKEWVWNGVHSASWG